MVSMMLSMTISIFPRKAPVVVVDLVEEVADATEKTQSGKRVRRIGGENTGAGQLRPARCPGTGRRCTCRSVAGRWYRVAVLGNGSRLGHRAGNQGQSYFQKREQAGPEADGRLADR